MYSDFYISTSLAERYLKTVHGLHLGRLTLTNLRKDHLGAKPLKWGNYYYFRVGDLDAFAYAWRLKGLQYASPFRKVQGVYEKQLRKEKRHLFRDIWEGKYKAHPAWLEVTREKREAWLAKYEGEMKEDTSAINTR